MEGQIRLRWTSHQGTVLSIFDALLSSESLVDVTLACEGQYIRAHKVILSACSPYFQELLSLDTNKHPIFFLKDVKYSELKALIHYMYRGEVNIAQDDLASLLVVAQALRIRGLAEVESANNSMSSDTIILPDIGNKSKVSTKVSSSVPTPVSVPSAATPSSSNLHLTRAFSQSHSFSSNINAVSTPIPSSSGVPSPSTAPPPPKKVRTETSARMSSGSQNVQKQSQKVDPLTVQMQPAIISTQTVPTQMFDPLQNTSTSGHYEPSGHGDDPNFGSEEIMVEQPEPMYTTDDVKLENEDQFITGAVEVDLEDEEENSMSQSSFTDNWKMSEGDNSGMADDDGEIPGGSGSNDGGVQGAEGGEDGRRKIEFLELRKPLHICDGRFFRTISSTPVSVGSGKIVRNRVSAECLDCQRTLSSTVTSNFISHLKKYHSLSYRKFLTSSANQRSSTSTKSSQRTSITSRRTKRQHRPMYSVRENRLKN